MTSRIDSPSLPSPDSVIAPSISRDLSGVRYITTRRKGFKRPSNRTMGWPHYLWHQRNHSYTTHTVCPSGASSSEVAFLHIPQVRVCRNFKGSDGQKRRGPRGRCDPPTGDKRPRLRTYCLSRVPEFQSNCRNTHVILPTTRGQKSIVYIQNSP